MFYHNARECDFGILKKKKKHKKNKGVGWQCSSQSLAMKSPVHCGNPEDDMQTNDTCTCIPVVHALFFFFTNQHLLSGISSFFDYNC